MIGTTLNFSSFYRILIAKHSEQAKIMQNANYILLNSGEEVRSQEKRKEMGDSYHAWDFLGSE